jgi:uncharacterized protein (DUF3084 family)
MNSPLVIAASVVGGLGGLSGLAALVKAFTGRRIIVADAEVKLSDEARQWVEQFQEDAREARNEARDARNEAAAARREATEVHSEMRAIKQEAHWLARQLQELHRAILDPATTLDRLRAMVGTGPGTNGTF